MQRWLHEGAAAAEESVKAAAAVPPAEDSARLKAEREATRDESTRREGTRRERLAAKVSRLPRGVRLRPRGGRHKVPIIDWPDDSMCCGVVEGVNDSWW